MYNTIRENSGKTLFDSHLNAVVFHAPEFPICKSVANNLTYCNFVSKLGLGENHTESLAFSHCNVLWFCYDSSNPPP